MEDQDILNDDIVVEHEVTLQDVIDKYAMIVDKYDPLYRWIVKNGNDGDFYCYYQSNVLKIYFRSPMGEKVFDKEIDYKKIDDAIAFCRDYLQKYGSL